MSEINLLHVAIALLIGITPLGSCIGVGMASMETARS